MTNRGNRMREREIKRGVRVFKRCNTIKESEIDIMVGRGYNEMEGKQNEK